MTAITSTTASLAALAGLLTIAGCCFDNTRSSSTVTDTRPGALNGCQMAFPTGDPSSSVVLLEKNCPAEVSVNQPFECTIRVTNLTGMEVDDVVVEDALPSTVKVARSAPEAQSSAGTTRWALGTLEPKETKTIRYSASAAGEGTISSCASVTYNSAMCCAIKVTQPALRVVKTAPAEVLACDPIPVKVTVTNHGSGTARAVKITEQLPAGVTTADGQSTLMFDVPSLGPGQSKEFTTSLKAARTGKYESKAAAVADGGLKAESAVTSTTVRQPVLAIETSGPERLYIGRPVTYTTTVTNTGDVVAAATVVEHRIPSGATLVSASNGGRVSGGAVVWSIGDLPPKASRKVSADFNVSSIGIVSNTATARATCAEPVSDSITTAFEGIPAILLEVVDANDPVPLGEHVVYEIRATNQGSAVGTGIKISCSLEDTMEFVSASGVTQPTQTGRTITFTPLASLAPKAVASWKVTVKAIREGDVRFAVKMNTDQLDRSVDETESTNFYSSSSREPGGAGVGAGGRP